MKQKIYLLLVMVLSLILASCADNTGIINTNSPLKEVAALNTDQNVLIFSTLSSANVLSEVVTPTSMSAMSVLEETPEIEIDMDKANKYLLMMENILAEGGPVVSTETESDLEDYDTMMVITFKDLAGNVSSYTIYYSIIIDEQIATDEEVLEGENSEEANTEETTDNSRERSFKKGHDDDRHDDEREFDEKHEKAEEQFKHHHHHEDNEEEVEYQIDALAVIEGVSYEVFAKKEVETDEDETEVEITFIIKLDEANYIKIEQEIEENEVEYKYSIYKDGYKTNSMTFKSEEENGHTYIKLTTNDNGVKETYKFYKSENRIVIKYESKGYFYTLYVTSKLDETTNEIVYDYKVKEKEFDWKYHKSHKDRH